MQLARAASPRMVTVCARDFIVRARGHGACCVVSRMLCPLCSPMVFYSDGLLRDGIFNATLYDGLIRDGIFNATCAALLELIRGFFAASLRLAPMELTVCVPASCVQQPLRSSSQLVSAHPLPSDPWPP